MKLCILVCIFGLMNSVGISQTVADVVLISDFSGNGPTAGGSNWTWDKTSKALDIVAPFNTSTHFLEDVTIVPNKDIAGATTLRLKAQWVPLGSSGGNFTVDLRSSGFTLAKANFSFSEFTGGFVTVEKPLTWVDPSHTLVGQWGIYATSFSGSGGDMFFDEMSTSGLASVPEPSSLLVFGIGMAGIAWTKRKRRKA